jgi:hypothetical protein
MRSQGMLPLTLDGMSSRNGTTGRLPQRRVKSPGCFLSRGINVVTGSYDTAVTSGGEMRSPLSYLSPGTNGGTGLHNETIASEE